MHILQKFRCKVNILIYIKPFSGFNKLLILNKSVKALKNCKFDKILIKTYLLYYINVI